MKNQRLNQWQIGFTTEKCFCDNLLALLNGSRIASVSNKAPSARDDFKRIREEVLSLDSTEYGRRFEKKGKDNE